jgi:hypothetical protein
LPAALLGTACALGVLGTLLGLGVAEEERVEVERVGKNDIADGRAADVDDIDAGRLLLWPVDLSVGEEGIHRGIDRDYCPRDGRAILELDRDGFVT